MVSVKRDHFVLAHHVLPSCCEFVKQGTMRNLVSPYITILQFHNICGRKLNDALRYSFLAETAMAVNILGLR